MNQKERDLAYLKEAYEFAMMSPDPSTQNGAIIVKRNDILDLSPRNVIAKSFNRFPIGVNVTEERLTNRELKYNFTGHAERNAIFAVARNKHESTVGKIMYVPWYACSDCGGAIVESGLKEVIGYAGPERWWKEQIEASGKNGEKDWAESIDYALTMFKEARLVHRTVDGPIGGIEVLFRGKIRQP